MISYQTLTDADCHELARARVHELEAMHFGTQLKLAECIDPNERVELLRVVADIQRRIDVHLVPVESDTDSDKSEDAEPEDSAPATVDGEVTSTGQD
jgi:hypothetical protein